MVSPQQHHHHGDQNTDECILLREEDNAKRFLCTVFQLTVCVFDHVLYVLLPERDDTIFVYRARFSVSDICSFSVGK